MSWIDFAAAAGAAGGSLGELRKQRNIEAQQELENQHQQKLLQLALSRDEEEKKRYQQERMERRAKEALDAQQIPDAATAQMVKDAGYGYRLNELEGPTPSGQPLYGVNLSPEQRAAETQREQQTFLFNQAKAAEDRRRMAQEFYAKNPNATPQQAEAYMQSIGAEFNPTWTMQANLQKQLASIRSDNTRDPAQTLAYVTASVVPGMLAANPGMTFAQAMTEIRNQLQMGGAKNGAPQAISPQNTADTVADIPNVVARQFKGDHYAMLQDVLKRQNEMRTQGTDPVPVIRELNRIIQSQNTAGIDPYAGNNRPFGVR